MTIKATNYALWRTGGSPNERQNLFCVRYHVGYRVLVEVYASMSPLQNISGGKKWLFQQYFTEAAEAALMASEALLSSGNTLSDGA